MKRKLLTLILAGVLIFSSSTLAMAADATVPTDDSQETTLPDSEPEPETPAVTEPLVPTSEEPTTKASTQYVSGADAVAAIGNTDILILDVRTKANYDKGHLPGSFSYPLFGANGVSDELKANFTEYVKNNQAQFQKKIYILCNSGKSGAAAGTESLIASGIDASNIYTITGGATDTTVQSKFVIDYKSVSGAEAVSKIGDADSLILDVRSADKFAKGHLKGSLSLPVFDANNNLPKNLQDDFVKYVNGHKQDFQKNIYILCNSGSRGAQTATKLLLDQGFALENIFTITNGAKDSDIKAKLTYVTAQEAVNSIGKSEILLLDVRSKVNYEKGHLKGSLSLPVFDADNSLPDNLATEFSAYVKANLQSFNKTIYILCNSGSRGAEKATILLKEAGIPAESIFTIEGGAKNSVIQANFVTTDTEIQNPGTPQKPGTNTNTNTNSVQKPDTSQKATTAKAPKTGDATSAIPYVLIAGIALSVIVFERKKIAK
ncbi:rhodanese-like domain-containing protein [Bariatricus sp. SGI.154]|uniref:rhodanese-like domain-containing protein n=1 Tax=Bariatricus sp. SGI.154 TaxID=3420549 RepID=UPI003D08AF10